MNRQESIQLLALIKLAYPNAYRGTSHAENEATVNMWHASFAGVPYPVMEQAFNGLRMCLKFPPTVAEMAEQLRKLHYEADQIAQIQRSLGAHDREHRYRMVAEATKEYKDWPKVSAFVAAAPAMIGGEYYVGTSGNRLDRADRVPQLDAGGL